MNGVRTRKQTAFVQQDGAKLNGHANPKDRQLQAPEQQENIFLFYPNIIGLQPSSWSSQLCIIGLNNPLFRLLPHHPGYCIPLLHASPSAHLLPPLQHFLSPRCPRRRRSSPLPAIDAFRRGPGHGDRPLHHLLPPCLPELRLSPMGATLPRPHQPGLRQPLHAHVRHARHG